MKKRTRRILFWIAVALFASISWIALKYAQGYAYNWSTGVFVRTGAIAVTTNTAATFFVDGHELKTSFIGNRAGRDGLIPDVYDIRVIREGYSGWRKDAEVQEGMLTDFPNVLLLPTDDESILALKQEASSSLRESATLQRVVSIVSRTGMKTTETTDGTFLLRGDMLYDTRTASTSLIAERVLGFTVSDESDGLLWWTRNEVWILWLKNTNQQPYRNEGEHQMLTRFSVSIQRASWFRGFTHVVVDVGNQSYRIVETDTRGGANIIKL